MSGRSSASSGKRVKWNGGAGVRASYDGVGKATTNTVYVIAISVLISDFFITKLFLAL